jgi:hypothetical protein
LFKRRAGRYVQSIRIDHAVPEPGSGGAATADGFEFIKVRRKTFVIGQYGGSSVNHATAWQFRYQNQNWYLIGELTNTGGIDVTCPRSFGLVAAQCLGYKVDTNFVTGRQISTAYGILRESHEETTRVIRRTLGKKKLMLLADFEPRSLAEPPP